MTTPKKHWLEEIAANQNPLPKAGDFGVVLTAKELLSVASELAAYRAGILEADRFIFRSTNISLPAFDKALELAKK